MVKTKKKPLQIYLRDDQIHALRRVAERRGKSIAAVIREGVDMLLEGLPPEEDPLLDIVGLYDSGVGDLAETHDERLVEILTGEGGREP